MSQPPNSPFIVSGNRTTSGPGVYLVQVTGITITLETWYHWADTSQKVIIKDMTGSATPNIIISAPNVVGGLIDNFPSITFVNSFEVLEFMPNIGGNTWIVL